MKMASLLIAALLAVALTVLPGSMIYGPNFNIYSAPVISLNNVGFNQLSTSDIGKTPILFAPSSRDLMFGGGIGAHYKPRLLEDNWSSSMRTSSINQMFVVLSRGIGNRNVP